MWFAEGRRVSVLRRPERSYRLRGAMRSSVLLLFRSRRLDNLIDLARSESVGFVPLRLFTDDFENFGLRSRKFNVIADIHQHGSGCAPLLDDERTPLDVHAAEHLSKVGAQAQGRDYDRAVSVRCCSRHKLSISSDPTVQFDQTLVNSLSNEIDERWLSLSRGPQSGSLECPANSVPV